MNYDNQFGLYYNCPPMKMQDSRALSSVYNVKQLDRTLFGLLKKDGKVSNTHDYRKIISKSDPQTYSKYYTRLSCNANCKNDFIIDSKGKFNGLKI